MDKKTCLETAIGCVTQDRQNDYGAPENNFATIAAYWNTFLCSKKGVGFAPMINPEDVAVMMGLLKVARMASSPQKADNYVDGAGYFAIAAELTDSK